MPSRQELGDNGTVPLYRDAAIVLRTHKLGEADRIVTMLSRGRGKVRAVAKGVRRTKSRFGARLEPGIVVDLQCYEGKNLDTVTQAEVLAPYGEQIARDYEAWTAMNVVLETADRLTEEGSLAPRQFRLLAGVLAALAAGDHEPVLALDSYLLRAMAIAGWSASFDACAKCGVPGPHRGFHVPSGGAVCSDCRPPGSTAPAPATFALLGALLRGDWAQVDSAEARVRDETAELVADFTQWHLDRGLRSLRYLDRGEAAPPGNLS